MKNPLATIVFATLFMTACLGQRTELPSVSLEDAGFNRDSIDNLLNEMNDLARKDFRGIVVIKNDQIVLEQYYNTFWRKTIHDIRSAGKSITALLLGVAIKEGLVD